MVKTMQHVLQWWWYFYVFGCLQTTFAAMSMKQIEQTMLTMRNSCSNKFPNLDNSILDNVKKGGFDDDNKELRCYVKCIGEMSGTLTKKGDVDVKKTTTQIESVLPAELREHARGALNACKDVTKNYKDSCDKVYYAAKCSYEFNPSKFMFP